MHTLKKRAPLAVLAVVLATLAFTAGPAAADPPSYVQSTVGTARGGTVATAMIGSTAGDLLVAFVVWDNTGPVHLSDNQAGVWKAATPQQLWNDRMWSAQTFYATAKTAATSVRATFALPLTTFAQLSVNEYANVAPQVDAASQQKGPMRTPMSVLPVVTSQSGDLLFVGGASTGQITAASPLSARSTNGNLTADTTAGVPGRYGASLSQNGRHWAMQMVAFKSTDPTMPMGDGVQDQCMFTTFCDNFATASPGGRGGDLDESKWSLSRESQETNAGQGLVDKFFSVGAEHCMDPNNPVTFIADKESFICGQEFDESNHWMEAIYDNGFFMSHAARILQPFDFANRTGTLNFSVDAKSTGGVGVWPEVWLTDQAVQSPHVQEDAAAAHAYPRNGIGLVFDRPEHCAGGVGAQQANSLREVDLFNNYALTALPAANVQCFTTQDDTPNHFEIKVDVNHVEVWASDAGSVNFRLVASAQFPKPLPFTRGYWNLEHVQYNASNALPCDCAPNSFTYHWHAVSFDGPVLPVDRDYQVPDSLLPTCGGANNVCGVNVGYTPGCWAGLPLCPNFTIAGVDKTGASTAHLTYDVEYTCCDGTSLNVTVNGHTHVVSDPDPNVGSAALDAWRYQILDVPLSELVQGTNTVTIGINHCNGSCPSVANIDLELTRS